MPSASEIKKEVKNLFELWVNLVPTDSNSAKMSAAMAYYEYEYSKIKEAINA